MNNMYYITRRRLAENLIMAGIPVEPCQNIYHADREAWKCDLSKKSAEVIRDFYHSIGKNLPDNVRDYLQ